ncbi:hypothetical protein [Bosea sp. (in: a-proteobacteria)]
MKNDTLDNHLATALDDVHVETKKLFTVAWIMRCMIDPTERPAHDSVGQVDVWYLLAELMEGKATQIDKIASEARLRLHHHMYPEVAR